MINKKPAIEHATERIRRIRERGWQQTSGLRVGLSGLVIFSLAPFNMWIKGLIILPIVLLILLDDLWLFFIIIGINILATFFGLLPQFIAGIALFLIGSVHFRGRASQLFDEHVYVKLQAMAWGVFTASFISLILSLMGWQFGFVHIIVAMVCLYLAVSGLLASQKPILHGHPPTSCNIIFFRRFSEEHSFAAKNAIIPLLQGFGNIAYLGDESIKKVEFYGQLSIDNKAFPGLVKHSEKSFSDSEWKKEVLKLL